MVEPTPNGSGRAGRAHEPSGAGYGIDHPGEDDAAATPFSLLSRLHHDPVMLGVFSERATVQSWLDTEAALALGQAALGGDPPGACRCDRVSL